MYRCMYNVFGLKYCNIRMKCITSISQDRYCDNAGFAFIDCFSCEREWTQIVRFVTVQKVISHSRFIKLECVHLYIRMLVYVCAREF